uniref:SOS response-associated peptidase n=1 Tax=Acetivibrio cellulolyticus TaxID=35830 RepID=UPI0001E2F638|nr:SOS response-associated peptidase [Acetivibrio cellulolyticus]
MCGRYAVFTEYEYDEIKSIIDEVSEKYKTSEDIVNGEVFPTNTAPVIYREKDKSVLAPMKWSYGQYSGRPIINARAETITEKLMFQSSLHQRRCLIPANAYYEWKQEEGVKRKTKFEISVSQSRIFFMAGIYNVFKDNNNKQYTGYAIITTTANQTTASIHDRMPVIIEPGLEKLWIEQNSESIKDVIGMLKPYTYKNVVLSAGANK